MVTTTHDVSFVFIELGLVIVGLAVLARPASRWGFSAIPLYLLAGLAFGNGGLAPLKLSENFVRMGAEIGVLLLLFMLGLEYSGDELKKSLRAGLPAGVVDFVLNFTPGLICGLLLGWHRLAAILLGGVTYISSSGVDEVERAKNRSKSTVRSKVEHVFAVMKLKFGFVKLRFRGLKKNATQLFAVCALVNLYLARKKLLLLAPA